MNFSFNGLFLKFYSLARTMDLQYGEIVFIDLIDKDSKDEFDERLRKICGFSQNPQSMNWMQMSDSGGTYTIWKLPNIPDNLNFLQELSVQVLLYARFPFAYQILIEGILSQNAINEITTSGKSSYEILRKIKTSFWKFCKENLGGLLVQNIDNIFFYEGCSVTNFIIKIQDAQEVLGDSWNNYEKLSNEFRTNPVVENYGINSIGLMSLYRIYQTQFVLISQSRGVFVGSDFDFTDISILEFIQETNQKTNIPFTQEYERLFKLLLAYLWFKLRLSKVPYWETRIKEFSAHLKKIGKKIEKDQQSETYLEHKGVFSVDYASILDEYRNVKKYLEFDESRFGDPYWAEIPVLKSPNFPQIQHGVIHELHESIMYYLDTVKERFDILRQQYDMISRDLSNYLNIVNVKSSKKLEISNRNTQITLAIFAIVIAGVTLYVNWLQYGEDLESSFVLDEVKKYAALTFESNFSDFELDLQYQILPLNFGKSYGGMQYEMSVANIGKYDVEVIHWWELSRLCDRDGKETYIESKSGPTLPYKITKNSHQNYLLSTERIYSKLSDAKSFELFMVVEAHPTTSKGLIQEISKRASTRIQFDYDENSSLWIPQFNGYELRCNEEINKSGEIKLTTTDPNHFLRLD